MRPFAIIVAIDSKYGIGKQGVLAWHLPPDLKHFKEITSIVNREGRRNAVIMGRKTWESLPDKFRPLPKRLNIILTKDVQFKAPPDVIACGSLDAALNQLPADIDQVFVIGGAQVYAQAIDHPACQKLHITHLKGDFSCDVFFPPISHQFIPININEEQCEGNISYHFCEYLKHF